MPETPITIAVDAMGGDNAPQITVDGACRITLETPTRLILVGDEEKIRAELAKHRYQAEQIEILHTPDEISAEDSPLKAVREKPNASVLLAAKLLSEGKADAMISAGGTGAVVLSAAIHVKRIPGVRRTALGIMYPTLNVQKREHIFSLMLDIGANVVNAPDDLVHFAYMGISYKKKILNVESPTVALLNIGAEEHKGNETMKAAYKLLASRPDIRFIGNIEGNELMSGKADVVVTEGLTGNIAMKTMEGTSEAVRTLGGMAMKGKLVWRLGLLCLSGGIKKVLKVANYEEYGGAPIFGYDKPVVKAHGRSTAYAFKNGIGVAIQAVQNDLIAITRESIAHFESDKNV
ncbi:MAG: phosphate acyltransferase PlsX [Chitinispirillaceae bacterium]|nr:phosphate acyltransferase PlsX [Chitinispirillaceae bacterium]